MDVVVGAAIGIVIGVTAALGIVFPTYQNVEREKQEKKEKQKQNIYREPCYELDHQLDLGVLFYFI